MTNQSEPQHKETKKRQKRQKRHLLEQDGAVHHVRLLKLTMLYARGAQQRDSAGSFEGIP